MIIHRKPDRFIFWPLRIVFPNSIPHTLFWSHPKGYQLQEYPVIINLRRLRILLMLIPFSTTRKGDEPTEYLKKFGPIKNLGIALHI